MFCNNFAIHTKLLTKSYKIYSRKTDRIKQYLVYALNFFRIDIKKKYYSEFKSLNNVSISIKPGVTVGIIGRNGAGKSTLLKILTGTTTPTRGIAAVRGRIIALLELGAGFNPDFTGIENIYFYSAILGVKNKEVKAKEKDIIEFADIGQHINQPVKSYSSGMFARLAFSVAINLNPDILIVDEALSVGDTKFQLKCFSKIAELKKAGKTIFYVSHDIYSIRTLCDLAIWLDGGEIQKKGHPNEVVNAYLQSLENKNFDDNECLRASSYSQIELKIRHGQETIMARSGEKFQLSFHIKNNGDQSLSFVPVFNIYRTTDNFYVAGATSLMTENLIHTIGPRTAKSIILTIRDNTLLAGTYRIRVAVNDETGMGVLAESKYAYSLTIEDKHEGEGLINLSPQWSFENDNQ